MNDLRTLFGSTREQTSAGRNTSSGSADASALRALVGAQEGAPNGSRPANSSALKDLVGGASLAEEERSAPGLAELLGGPKLDSAAHSRRDLAALVGGSPATSGSAPKSDLTTLVGTGGTAAEQDGWRAPELAQVGKRPIFGGRRKAGAVNYLSVAAAVLAVVAIVGTASFAVVQRATANPADDAMISLREREAELANDTKVLQTAADLYAASIAEGAALAQNSGPVLTALQSRVDPVPLAAAEASRMALLQATEVATTVTVPTYARAAIDEKSLADVGEAIDDVRLAKDSLPALVTAARDARSQVTSALSSFRVELTSLGSAIETEATKIVVTNDSASQSFRAAVTDAAARVRASQQAGGDGLSEMPVFAAAVDALRTENQRVLALEEAEREATPSQPSTRNPGSGGSNSGGGSSNPGNSNPSPTPAPSQPSSPSEPSTPPSDPPTEEPTEEPSQPPIVTDPPVDEPAGGTGSQ